MGQNMSKDDSTEDRTQDLKKYGFGASVGNKLISAEFKNLIRKKKSLQMGDFFKKNQHLSTGFKMNLASTHTPQEHFPKHNAPVPNAIYADREPKDLKESYNICSTTEESGLKAAICKILAGLKKGCAGYGNMAWYHKLICLFEIITTLSPILFLIAIASFFFGTAISDLFGGIGDIESLFGFVTTDLLQFLTFGQSLGQTLRKVLGSGYDVALMVWRAVNDVMLRYFPLINMQLLQWTLGSIYAWMFLSVYDDLKAVAEDFKFTTGWYVYDFLMVPIVWAEDLVDMRIWRFLVKMLTLPYKLSFFLIGEAVNFIISIFSKLKKK